MRESSTPTSNPPEFTGEIEFSGAANFPLCEQATRTLRELFGNAGFRDGAISIAIVDNQTIHELNLRYLAHDWPTDVLSFLLERDDQRQSIEGEIVVSHETARRHAREIQWEWEHELFLYMIHGALHLTGLDDETNELRAQMRVAEDQWLGRAGILRAPHDKMSNNSPRP